jgi:hypothetical protein
MAIVFFILSVALFFTQKIPEVIRFKIKTKNQRFTKTQFAKGKQTYSSPVGGSDETMMLDDGTVLLNDDQTQLLNIAQNYATALLDAENINSLDEEN